MPIAPFPHRYTVAMSDGELVAPPRENLLVGAPPQFGGSDRVWSPEELLVGAALVCLQTTFTAYARRAALAVRSWTATATGTLVKASGGPTFESIELSVVLTTDAGEEARAAQVLRDAERNCIISRALRAPVHVTLAFGASTAHAAAAGEAPLGAS
jgi:organic hydroperoxide reductase OsmC/OhrA